MNESQRAMVAAKLANMPAHRPADNSANLQTSQADAAGLLNVSTRTVASAAKVRNEGTPELVRAVERGAMSVSSAAQVAAAPADVPRSIIKETARLKIAGDDPIQKIQRPHVAENTAGT